MEVGVSEKRQQQNRGVVMPLTPMTCLGQTDSQTSLAFLFQCMYLPSFLSSIYQIDLFLLSFTASDNCWQEPVVVVADPL